MGQQRNWYAYEFKKGNKVLHEGITKNLEQREKEHQANLDPKGHIRQVGLPKTEDGARRWEKKQGCA